MAGLESSMDGASESKQVVVADRDLLMRWYDELHDAFGPQYWWPGDSPDEVAIGAVLTQNTSWKNVEKAIDRLKAADVLRLDRMHELGEARISELIQPAGAYRVKARRLKALAAFVVDRLGGDVTRLAEMGIDDGRVALLGVHGVGPETADAILLYAAGLPTFVVDAYTKRILSRHFLVKPAVTYDEMKRLFEDALPADVQMFNEYHALLVALAKGYCRKVANCAGCPLEHWPHERESLR